MEAIVKTKLMPHQEAHVARAVKKKRFLLCEKAGKGKSLIELSAFVYLYNRGVIDFMYAAAPLAAYEKQVWKTECEKHTNLKAIDLETLITKTSGDPSKALAILKHYPVVTAKHSHVKKHYSYIAQLIASARSMVVIDEVHAMKNPSASLTSFSRIAYMHATALHALTATPLSKDLTDTYNIINFVSPGYLGSYIDFRDTYCHTHEEVVGRTSRGLRKIVKIDGLINPQLFEQKIWPLVLKGESLIIPQYHFIPYELTKDEADIYRKIASGIAKTNPDAPDAPNWLEQVMTGKEEEKYYMKDLQAHASRFIYLQFAADGIVNKNGEIGASVGSKYKAFLPLIDQIIKKGQSSLIYFTYHKSVDVMEALLNRIYGNQIVVLKSTGKSVLGEGQVTEQKVLKRPHIILCTKAGSESVSYYFINNVIFFHYPTVSETMIQMAGRICRVNTLYPGDLHIWCPSCQNIDLYKLFVVSTKTRQMEFVAGEEGSIPNVFKNIDWSPSSVKRYKNNLIWNIKSEFTLDLNTTY